MPRACSMPALTIRPLAAASAPPCGRAGRGAMPGAGGVDAPTQVLPVLPESGGGIDALREHGACRADHAETLPRAQRRSRHIVRVTPVLPGLQGPYVENMRCRHCPAHCESSVPTRSACHGGGALRLRTCSKPCSSRCSAVVRSSMQPPHTLRVRRPRLNAMMSGR